MVPNKYITFLLLPKAEISLGKETDLFFLLKERKEEGRGEINGEGVREREREIQVIFFLFC